MTFPSELADWMGAAGHFHSASGLPRHDCQGKQTYPEIGALLKNRGISGCVLTEHSAKTKIGAVASFDDDDPQAVTFREYVDRVKGDAETQAQSGVRFYVGAEVSITADGIDMPEATARYGDFVLAAFHGEVPKDPAIAEHWLMQVLDLPYVHAIAHPTRNLEHMPLDALRRIFARARESGVAIERNFNHWWSYGPGRTRRKLASGEESIKALYWQLGHHYTLARLMAEEDVAVLNGYDVHSREMMPRAVPLVPHQPTVADLVEYERLGRVAGITSGLIINRSSCMFEKFLQTAGTERHKLFTAV